MTLNDNQPRYSTAIRHMRHTSGTADAIKLAVNLLGITEAEATYYVRSLERAPNDVVRPYKEEWIK